MTTEECWKSQVLLEAGNDTGMHMNKKNCSTSVLIFFDSFFSELYTQHGPQTQNPKIESRRLYQLRQPSAPYSSTEFKNTVLGRTRPPKRSTSYSPQSVNRLPYKQKGVWINSRPWDEEIILDYLVGPNQITKVLSRKRWLWKHSGFADGRRGPKPRNVSTSRTWKSQENRFPPEHLERNAAQRTPWFYLQWHQCWTSNLKPVKWYILLF